MPVTVPDSVLHTTRMTEEEMLQELAVALFAKEKLTLGQAAVLAGMNQFEFGCLLASRGIPVHYDIADYEEDLTASEELDRL